MKKLLKHPWLKIMGFHLLIFFKTSLDGHFQGQGFPYSHFSITYIYVTSIQKGQENPLGKSCSSFLMNLRFECNEWSMFPNELKCFGMHSKKFMFSFWIIELHFLETLEH